MRLVRATIVTPKCGRTCNTCGEGIAIGEEAWREVWEENDDTETVFYHIHCEGEDESREEHRRDLIEYLSESDSV